MTGLLLLCLCPLFNLPSNRKWHAADLFTKLQLCPFYPHPPFFLTHSHTVSYLFWSPHFCFQHYRTLMAIYNQLSHGFLTLKLQVGNTFASFIVTNIEKVRHRGTVLIAMPGIWAAKVKWKWDLAASPSQHTQPQSYLVARIYSNLTD